MPSNVASVGAEILSPSACCSNRPAANSATVVALTNEHKHEVLDFLALRPVHTVCMAGFILDNGVISSANRGFFCGWRNESGNLEGVALIGHATLVETQNEHALKAFAGLQQRCFQSHLIRGELETIARFWHYYSGLGQEPRLACRELLLEAREIPDIEGPLPDLQPATLDQLEELLEINSQFILAECGVDPLKNDPIGFQERLERRIQKERVQVCFQDGRLLFKADIFSETPQMAYLEGVFVHPDYRGRRHGLRCLTQLSKLLLRRSKSVCLLINERRNNLASFYQKAGYEERGIYGTIYLKAQAS